MADVPMNPASWTITAPRPDTDRFVAATANIGLERITRLHRGIVALKPSSVEVLRRAFVWVNCGAHGHGLWADSILHF
jgi:hypothetical protein